MGLFIRKTDDNRFVVMVDGKLRIFDTSAELMRFVSEWIEQ